MSRSIPRVRFRESPGREEPAPGRTGSISRGGSGHWDGGPRGEQARLTPSALSSVRESARHCRTHVPRTLGIFPTSNDAHRQGKGLCKQTGPRAQIAGVCCAQLPRLCLLPFCGGFQRSLGGCHRRPQTAMQVTDVHPLAAWRQRSEVQKWTGLAPSEAGRGSRSVLCLSPVFGDSCPRPWLGICHRQTHDFDLGYFELTTIRDQQTQNSCKDKAWAFSYLNGNLRSQRKFPPIQTCPSPFPGRRPSPTPTG